MKLPLFFTQHRQWVYLLLGVILLAILGLFSLSTSRAQWGQLSFGQDRGIQLVDPAGLNQIPFWLNSSTATVDFTLYHLSATDFLARYATYQPYNPQSIDVTGLSVAANWQHTFDTGNYYDIRPVRLPTGTVASGIYVIRATSAGLGEAMSMIVVGRTVLVLKRGAGGQVVAWASYLQSSAPVSNMIVTLYAADGNVITQGNTDSDGLVTVTVGNATPLMAIGATADEMTIAGLDWQWRSDGDYWWVEPTSESHRIYLYTDRPIYRPGHTVYYHAFVRNKLLTGYTPLATTELVTVTLRDSRNNVVTTETKNADAFGALDGSFVLGDEPPLGDYTAELTVNGQTQRQKLRVEEYRKPEYEVKVQTPVDYAVAGETLPITVAADYFFGQPVATANVTLQVYRQRLYRYSYWWWHDYGYYNRELVTTLTGVTDGKGRWETIFTPEVTSDYDALYSFEATVTDARQLPVSGSRAVRVYWNAFTLRAETPKYGYRTDDVVRVNLQAQGHDQTPITGQNVNVRIIRHAWDEQSETDAVPPQQATTDSQGKATLNFANVPQGWYRLVATSTDGRGRTVTAYNYLWVYDPASNVWWYTNDDQISITPDRDSYAPGDTAQLLVQSRVTGVALLTLERDGIHEERIIPINGPMTTVAVPITADFAPNIFAKLHIFAPTEGNTPQANREGRLLTAQTELTVPATAKRLTVSITADATQYRPGEQAVLTVQVSDGNGQPVQARVGLALVDEAIFALQSDLSADLFATFYGAKPNGVATYDGLVRQPYNYYPVLAEPLATGTPDAEAPAEGDEGTRSNDSQPRRTLLDTAYWNPHIDTDAAGKATISVPLPDNLTTWRMIARAITVDTQVSDTRAKLLVTKAIIARPALPRFGIVGDQFVTGLVAQNFSGSDTSGTTELAATNLVLLNDAKQSVNLPNAGSAVNNWTTVASDVGTGLITTTLTTANGQDIVELPFTVKPFSGPERWVAAGMAAPTATETFTVPFNAVNDVSSLTIRLAPSLALGLLDGLDELIDYPYGCVEQTMSRVLPSAVASKAYADLGIPNPKAAELPKIINQGLQKLYGFQHNDGSWGWFYDDDGGVYLSSYVLLGLTMVQQAGFTVESNVLEKGFAYLDTHLGQVSDAGTLAFALYIKAVANRGDLARAQLLKVRIGEMDSAAVAALALALQLGGDVSGAQQVLDQLLARAVATPTTAYWPLNGDKWEWHHWQSMASTEKNTALAVRALVTLRPTHPLLPQAIRWLMEHRQGAGWSNTQATAFAVLGLADYIRSVGELQASYSYEVVLNGQTIATGQVTPETVRQPIAPIVVVGDRFQQGANQLEVHRSIDAATPLYYTAMLRQELFYDSFTQVTSVDQGLALKRTYRLVEGTLRKDSAYAIGDVVEVTLEVEVREQMAYLLVEDPLPAGFEALEERMNPVSYGDYFPFFWQEWGYNRKNIRDDRVDFFITQAWPGTHRLTYLMRATTPGEFSVLPGQAYPMYKDSVWGRSASQLVQVTPEQMVARPGLVGDFDRNCRVTRFDTWQVVGVWGETSTSRNVVGNTQIDLQDIAAVAQREGARCLADQALPAQSSDIAQVVVTTPERTIQVGEQFDITVDLVAGAASNTAGGLGGFALTLHFDPTRLAVADVRWPQGGNRSLPLGPKTDLQSGLLRVGVYHPPADAILMTITFVGRGVGAANVAVVDSEAVNTAGEQIGTEVQTNGGVTVEGKQLFLPVIVTK